MVEKIVRIIEAKITTYEEARKNTNSCYLKEFYGIKIVELRLLISDIVEVFINEL